jgi:hypothetical protein
MLTFPKLLGKNELIEIYRKLGENMQVYLAVVLLKPTKKEAEEGAVEKVVVQPTVVVASDVPNAKVKALREVPKEYQDLDSRLEVRVIAFHG